MPTGRLLYLVRPIVQCISLAGHQQQLTPVAQGTERDATNVEVEVRVLVGVLLEHGLRGGTEDARGSDPRARTGMQVRLLPGARNTEVEHGGLCSALMRRRIRFDS